MTSKKEFALLMATLRVYYGKLKIEEEDWRLMLSAWYERLKNNSYIVLSRAFDRAWKQHKDFFPTLGQLQAIIDDLSKTTLVPSERRLEEESNTSHEEAKKRIGEILNLLNDKMDLNSVQSKQG
jgi:hypothetical protein